MGIVTNSVMCGVFLSNNFYLMQMYTNKTNEKKNKHFFFPWYCDYAERQPFDEIKHRHTLNEVGDVADGQYVWMIYDTFIAPLHNSISMQFQISPKQE